ncbi:MAG: LUD domain-containing protein [Bacteroidota bacterium]
MKESTTKEKILKKVRNALMQDLPTSTADIDFDNTIYNLSEEPLEIQFVEEFNKQGGQFIFCDDNEDLAEKIKMLSEQIDISNIICADPKLLKMLEPSGISFISNFKGEIEAHACITDCEFLISRSGSIMISSKQTGGRKSMLSAPVIIVIAELDQLVSDIKDAMIKIRTKYPIIPSMLTMITGPSKTMLPNYEVKDIGIGHKEMYLFLLDQF